MGIMHISYFYFLYTQASSTSKKTKKRYTTGIADIDGSVCKKLKCEDCSVSDALRYKSDDERRIEVDATEIYRDDYGTHKYSLQAEITTSKSICILYCKK
ncbi:hypothetical protein BDAP_000970 [Binucleata daphniae]